VSDKCVRPIDAALASVPPQAHMCSLAYIKVRQRLAAPGFQSWLCV